MTRTPRAICICLLVPTLLVGCGTGDTNRGAISGSVKLEGQPLEQGAILFTPIEGTKGTVAGGQITRGRYQLSGKAGPAVGWNRVEIRALRKTGRMIPKPFPAQGEMVEEQVEAIPPQFNSQSTLKFQVKPGENTADFEVSSVSTLPN